MAVGLYSGVSGLAVGVGLYRGVSGLWGGSSGLINGFGGGAITPSLNLDLLYGPLDSRITFSRGSNATMIDGTGRIVYAPANLLLWSEEFDNAAWGKTNSTVTANVGIAPDGTLTADALIPTSSTAVHRIGQGATVSGLSTLTSSVYAKANGYNKVAILDAQHTAAGSALVDLRDGTTTNIANTVGTTVVTGVGNGWYRISWTFSGYPPTAVNYSTAITPAPDSGFTNSFSSVFAGNGVDGILIWGAQFEPVTYQTTPSTYNRTTATAYYGPRFDAFPVTCLPRGLLLEGARTNILTYSDQFNNAAWTKSNCTITANATTSPDGTVNADKIVEAVGTVTPLVRQTPTVSAVSHTYSIYMKAAERSWARLINVTTSSSAYFNLSSGVVGTVSAGVAATIASVGSGWYRCTITETPTAASNAYDVRIATSDGGGSYTGDGTSGIFAWGAQLETGNFVSSYIPTGASTATRNADSAIMTGNNFSSWYTLQSGTLVVGAEPEFASTTGKPSALLLQSGTPNYHALYVDGPSGTLGYDVASSGVVMDFLASSYSYTPVPALQASLYSSVASQYAVYGQAVTYSNNFFANSANGGPATTDTSGAVPEGLTSMVLGQNDGEYGYGGWFGWLRGVQAYGAASSTATLNQLSDAAGAAQQTLSLDFTGEMYYSGTVPFQTPPSFYVGFTVDAYVTED